MRLIDWREADAATLAHIWTAQAARWAVHLSWDSAGNWADVETQRRAGRLPGLILLDGATVVAWSFFLIHQDTLQIGAFEADSSEATRLLLDAVLSTVDDEMTPAGAILFAFSAAPGLVPALVARGFETEPYLHLVREVADARAALDTLPWRASAMTQLPELLARAYGPPTVTRPFARRGKMEEWEEYAGQLLGSAACGVFEPELSAASVSADGSLEAAIITTLVGPGTAHVAQVVVDPARRGRGLAEAMLGEVIARTKRLGYDRVSLLVSVHNTGAVRLYSRLGFSETASFVSAGRRGQPRRSTSPAFDTGGANTFL